MAKSYIYRVTPQDLLHNCGGKAEQIQQLLTYDVEKVPVTHVCSWEAYEAFVQGEQNVSYHLREELNQKLDLSKSYAVRSSANIEDGYCVSFAGQFSSLLNITGIDNLLKAIEQVWLSARRGELDAYLAKMDYAVEELRMAVILQQMVKPVVSGVVFNKNPVTGLDEIVVEAVSGTGEVLVQEGITPDRWIYKWGDWISKPTSSLIDTELILQVVQQTKEIAARCGRCVDLEWVYDGQDIYWIQLRDITSVDHHNIYSNRMAREMLPGIIKPLVWSVNTRLMNSVWVDIFTELIGPNDIKPEDLAKSFYYRAYFNMGTIGRIFEAVGMQRETLEIMMGMKGGEDHPKFQPSMKVMKHIPRLTRFMISKMLFDRDLDAFLPLMDCQYASFASRDLSELDEAEILDGVNELFAFTKKAAYRNIVGPLLMHAYNGLLRRQLQQIGIEYDNFDLTNNFEELEHYDPNSYLDRLAGLFFGADESAELGAEQSDLQSVDMSVELEEEVSLFIERFGHLSESGNDFSQTPWREDKDLVQRMIANRMEVKTSEASDHESSRSSTETLIWDDLPVTGFKRLQTRWLYGRARKYRYYREAISFKYTFGYGLFRKYFLALADKFCRRGIIENRDDIFLLYLDEVRSIAAGGIDMDYICLVEQRKREIEAVKDVVLPEVIYGEQPPPVEICDETGHHLSGIPTSGGYFQGSVRVIRSLSEFDKMLNNAVLVIPFSDISWAPLFAQAGAIIAESGGMLSHSSIVAREYRIPAVVSITNACRLLKDDMIVTVDGFKGEVIIKQANPSPVR
jgi:phosphohistidine swiveling domain-containing protein